MKKIILSVAVATMALSTAAAALEDIKVNGQAKLWYETNNGGTNDMFNKNGASGEVVFKLGVTGKQGNVGFGTTVYQTSTMGLEGTLVSGTRDLTTNLGGSSNSDTQANGDLYVGEMYITVPLGAKTLLKFGKQELDTPLAFTERWNATPNTFNAAVAINSSINNLTLIGAYVGQGSANDASGFKSTGTPTARYMGTSVYAAGALFKNDAMAANIWAYELSSVAKAYWLDAGVKVGPASIKAYAAMMDPAANGADDTTAFALSAGMKAGSVKLFAAASTVSDDGVLPVANTATGFKKTKLPTMGVYTDGRYVGLPGSTAFKLKAATKVGGAGLALQGVFDDNDNSNKDMMEVDLIATYKLGDVNLKGILMHRDGDAGIAMATNANGTKEETQQHVRVIASVNF